MRSSLLACMRPATSPETDTLYKVLMGPVSLNQSGAKEMGAAAGSEQPGESFSALCSKQDVHVRDHVALKPHDRT